MFDLYKTAVLKSFQDSFQKHKDKRIVIYGTGDIARFIMEEFSGDNIIGFLDGKRSEGTALGRRIFSLEEIKEIKPDMIIIAAKKNNIPIIFERICHICHASNIPVYAVDGRNLFTAFGYGGLTCGQEEYGKISEQALREEILRHDVISFDIFDVLIMRKTLFKEDVLCIVEDRLSRKGIIIPGFRETRLRAELEAAGGGGTIHDIYSMFAKYSGVGEEVAKKALETELEIENNIMCCREKMKELLYFAVQNGKQVYLVEDTYFPQDIVRAMLERQGITRYNGMFLSCEYKKTKEQGLFGILRDEAKGQAYLHIGRDAGYGEKKHMDVFTIKSAYDMFCMSSYRNLRYSLNSANERSMAGMLAAKVFNNPFSLCHSQGKPEIDNVYDFGYVFVAPLMTKYVLWIIDQVKKGQYEDVLFAARDGFITQKLYVFALQKLNIDLPKGIYFHTSRNVCIISTIKDEEDIEWIANVPFDKDINLQLKMRFNLEPPKGGIQSDILTYALRHKDEIYEKSARTRDNYLKYMENIGLKENCKYAFVDFVSCGSCQALLTEIIPFEIEGLYFGRYWVNNKATMNLPNQSLFESYIEELVYCSYAFENYLFLETIMTSTEPTLAGMDEKGEPVFGEEDRNEEVLQYVKDVHRGIEDYFRDFISNLYIAGSDIDKHFADTIFSYREKEYTNVRCSIFNRLVLFDDLRQRKAALDRKRQ